ncbi:MAG: DUF2877 domain-containing protein [Betaproteobacteria bacterium]|nr:DUF2877 domain-containing protein [Betaproteobacteria bacterium]
MQVQVHAARIVSCGQVACVALKESGGVAMPVAGFEDAPYAQANGEILWVGAHLPAMHPRAVVTSLAVPSGMKLSFEAVPAHGWLGHTPRFDEAAVPCISAEVERLRGAILDDPPKGFGAWLAGRPLPFPLHLAASRLSSLAQAHGEDDPDAVFDAAAGLLGFGTGLTPSGDDLVGASLFARRLMRPWDDRWEAAAQKLALLVGRRSHRLSAAMFRDLVRGQSFAPLHELAQALVAGGHDQALQAAQRLVRIGHSSGWDMFTGFILGATGEHAGLPAN